MAEIEDPNERTIKLFERAEALLQFFLDFNEDFNLLQSIFGVLPEQGVQLQKISGQDDIKLAILRDEIVSLVALLQEVEIRPDGAEQHVFDRLVVKVQGMIKETTKLRKRFESAAGYIYDIDIPTFKVIGNNSEVKRNHVLDTSSLSSSKVTGTVSITAIYNPPSTTSLLKSRQLDAKAVSSKRMRKLSLSSEAYNDNRIKAALLEEKKRNVQLRADVKTMRLEK